MKICVLGHTGMLGHTVVKFLKQNKIEVETTSYKWPSIEFINFIKKSKSNFLLNCIACIPQAKTSCNQFYNINYKLPLYLSKIYNGVFIQQSTNSEFEVSTKTYTKKDIPNSKDLYGVSKRLATKELLQIENCKVIRCSLIGPEIKNFYSLYEWFKKNKSEVVYGYTDSMWNGLTTYEWSKQILNILNSNEKLIHLSSNTVSKFNLLNLLNKYLNLNKKIIPKTSNSSYVLIDSDIKLNNLENQIKEIVNWYYLKI